MPRGDGTGPLGVGPMSGRGGGFCASRIQAGYGAGLGIRRGQGMPLSRGWGGGLSTQAEYISPGEKEILARRAQALQRELDQMRAQLNNLSEENTTQD